MSDIVVIVEDDGVVNVVETAEVVNVIETPAAQGPSGAAGQSANASYPHMQGTALDVWTVNHNLGFRPAITVLSVGGREMWAEILHTSANQAMVYFDSPVAGMAICS